MNAQDDIERAEPAAASVADHRPKSSELGPLFERAVLWLRSESRLLLLIAACVIATAAAVGLSYGLALAMLIVAGGALISVIGLLWGSVQNLTGEAALSFDEALSLAAPSAEEEQKRALLRALKDLEYEKSVGKISEEDYQELSARYRAEAKRLLQLLEQAQEPARQRVDELVRKRLVQEGLVEPGAARKPKKKKPAKALESPAAANSTDGPTAPESSEPDASAVEAAPVAVSKAEKPAAAPTRRCGSCEARNDLDARFCKRCGEPLSAEEQALCPACPAVYDRALAACPECGVERAAT